MKLSPLLEIAARSTIVYVSIYLALRVAGKRHLAQLSLRDFVLVLLVSNAVQNAMVGSDSSLIGGLVAAGVLILANLFITRLELRSRVVVQQRKPPHGERILGYDHLCQPSSPAGGVSQLHRLLPSAV